MNDSIFKVPCSKALQIQFSRDGKKTLLTIIIIFTNNNKFSQNEGSTMASS